MKAGSSNITATEAAPISLVAILVALILVWLNYWQRDMLNALTGHNQSAYWLLMWQVVGFLVAGAVLYGLRELVSVWAGNRLRLRRFHVLSGAYFTDKRFELLRLRDAALPVPQRLVDDCRESATLSVSLLQGAVGALTRASCFVIVLWQVLPSYSIGGWWVPAPLVLFSLVMFLISFSGLRRLSCPLPELETTLADQEAALRTQLARVTEYSRSVALLDGGAAEHQTGLRLLGTLLSTGLRTAVVRARVTGASFVLGPGDIFVWLLLAPLFFSGQITFGEVFQAGGAQSAFGAALSWFFDQAPTFARWRAAHARLDAFMQAIQDTAKPPPAAAVERAGDAVSIRSLTLELPEQNRMVSAQRKQVVVPDLDVAAGDKVILRAPSGFGKSTLLAVLAGSWPAFNGHAALPEETVWVPQQAYFPASSLRDALRYPSDKVLDDGRLAHALAEVNLVHLLKYGDDVIPWNATLSGGELARLAMARALLKQPRCLLLDEPMAALDADQAGRCWQILGALPSVTVIAVAHQIEQVPGGSFRVVDLSQP